MSIIKVLVGTALTFFGLVYIIAAIGDGEPRYYAITAVGLLIGIPLIISGFIGEKRETKIRQEERRVEEADKNRYIGELNNWKYNEYDELLRRFKVSIDGKRVTIKRKNNRLTWRFGTENYIFILENNLYLFPVFDEYQANMGDSYNNNLRGPDLVASLRAFFTYVQIPMEMIEYFGMSGEIYRENRISGGGGGGTDIGGAIIGGIIAGGVGAVIGSRKESEPIKSEVVTHDSRETVLSYFFNGSRQKIVLKREDYQVLEDLMPEKNYNIVMEVKKQELIRQNSRVDEPKAITEQIKELAKLKDDGILTEEEFVSKKSELLAKM